MVVNRISGKFTRTEWLNEFSCQFLRPLNAGIKIVSLSKIYVLEKISADGFCGNGIAVHLNAREIRDRTFDGHQPFTQVFVDCGRHVARGYRGRHRRLLRIPSLINALTMRVTFALSDGD